MKEELTTDLIEKLTMFRVKQNHTKRWGVLVGQYSCSFVFMHEDKQKCLEHIRDNYESYFTGDNGIEFTPTKQTK